MAVAKQGALDTCGIGKLRKRLMRECETEPVLSPFGGERLNRWGHEVLKLIGVAEERPARVPRQGLPRKVKRSVLTVETPSHGTADGRGDGLDP